MRPKTSTDVKASFVISQGHDSFLKYLKARRRWNRSQVVREALDRLMADPAIFSPSELHNGAVDAHQSTGVTR